MLEREASRSNLKFWVSWFGLTLGAYAIGIYLSIMLRQLVVFGTTNTAQYPSIFFFSKRVTNLWPPGAVLGIASVTGLLSLGLIGLAQWVVLRRRMDLSALWILATAAGVLIAAPIETVIVRGAAGEFIWLQRELLGLSNLRWLSMSRNLLMALVVASLQWRLLSNHIEGAGWWVPAVVLITMVAYFLTSGTGLPFMEWRQSLRWSPLVSSLGLPVVERLAAMLPGLLMQAIGQALKGLVLIGLMAPRQLERKAVPATA